MVLTGVGHGSGGGDPILARAALLSDDGSGRATLSETLLTDAARLQKRGEDPLQIVLVSADAAYALLLRLPAGLSLAGVIAEWPMAGGDSTPLPVVSGLENARESIPEGEFVLLDAERGRVVVAPDAVDIARLQETQRRRAIVLLGAAHYPARTLSGQTIAVWARVYDAADVDEAMAQGADGILIDGPGDLLPEAATDPERTLTRLLAAVDRIGGGDVGLLASPDVVDPGTVVSLAARCRLRWILPPDDLPLTLPELREELKALTREEQDERRSAALPQIAALLGAVPALDEPDEELFAFDEAVLFPFSDADIDALTLSTVYNLPRLRVYLSGNPGADDPVPALPAAAAAGAYGLIVPPSVVAAAKDQIRTLE